MIEQTCSHLSRTRRNGTDLHLCEMRYTLNIKGPLLLYATTSAAMPQPEKPGSNCDPSRTILEPAGSTPLHHAASSASLSSRSEKVTRTAKPTNARTHLIFFSNVRKRQQVFKHF